MSDELTDILPDSVPDTEPTMLTVMERLRSMQELMDRRHLESQELIASVREDVNQVRADVNQVRDDVNQVRDDVKQNYELLVSRIESLHAATDGHFRKQEHVIHALNDNLLHSRGDQRELFERIAVLEEKAS